MTILARRREHSRNARTAWGLYRVAVLKLGGPDPGWPSDRELRAVYGQTRTSGELLAQIRDEEKLVEDLERAVVHLRDGTLRSSA